MHPCQALYLWLRLYTSNIMSESAWKGKTARPSMQSILSLLLLHMMFLAGLQEACE